MEKSPFDIKKITSEFCLPGEYVDCEPIKNGHINDTFKVRIKSQEGEKQFLIQRINTDVFKDPDALMENIIGVTDHIRRFITKNGGDPERETLKVYPTGEGKNYYRDENGSCWRCYNYVAGTSSRNVIDDPAVFYNAAKAFGRFRQMLADYPIESLNETIPDFHDTVKRVEALERAIAQDAVGRAAQVTEEIAFARKHSPEAGRLLDLLEKGELSLSVTHNDTKLNNVLFDETTNQGICVVDLDTVMPGLSLYDFGDAIRFGANTASEGERDLTKVSFDLELYKVYVQGYIEASGSAISECEVNNLAFASKLMTYECGIRFLTDYLNGDVYFNISKPDDNIARCRTQFALIDDMESKWEQMEEIAREVYRGKTND